MSNLDFAQIKQAVSLQQAATMLGLTLKEHNGQYRGPCPACKRGGERALVITPEKGWSCFAAKKGDGRYPGGDVIALVAHIRGVSFKDAAHELAGHFPVNGPKHVATALPATERKPIPDTLSKVREYLIFEHDKLHEIGLEPNVAEGIGWGHKPKGQFSGSIAVPLFNRAGQLIGYAAFKEGRFTFPNNLAERI